jgi:hypothetical protein
MGFGFTSAQGASAPETCSSPLIPYQPSRWRELFAFKPGPDKTIQSVLTKVLRVPLSGFCKLDSPFGRSENLGVMDLRHDGDGSWNLVVADSLDKHHVGDQ